MSQVLLNAQKRETAGKGSSHKIRANGSIPGILYGPDIETLSVSIKTRELTGLIRREGRANMLIDLNLGESNTPDRKVIIKELQRDPITGDYQHIDLYQVSMTRELNMMVKVKLVGTPSGVKNAGGILQQIRREIEISCLPSNIPGTVEMDVSNLDIGDSIHVSDITIPNAEIITDTKLTICTVVPPTVIKTAEETAAAEAAEGAEGAEGEEKPEGAEGEEKPEGKKAEGKKDEK